MKKLNFNHGWTCRCLADDSVVSVTLPHDAMLAEKRSEKSMGGKNIGWFEARDYVYEKRFTLAEELLHQTLLLEIEGAYRESAVSLNGEELYTHLYGYTGYTVDLTGKVRAGENLLKVEVRNANQPNSRWYTGTGLYRPVSLWTAEKTRICHEGVRIRTLSIDPAEVEVTVRVQGEGEMKVEILDGENCVADAQACVRDSHAFRIAIPGAKLWNVDTPNLYRCRVTFGSDAAEENFGVRLLTWDGEKGLAINGERVILRGACIHHDNGLLGACAYAEAEERKVRLMKKAGYNALRSAHNPCSKALLDACDRLGMLMMDEYVDMWYIHKTRYDYALHMEKNWPEDLAAMVNKDYNHPCVVLYSTGNEVAETGQKRGIELTKQMTERLHRLDGTRPVTCGVNIFFNYLYSIGFGVYSDGKAEKDAKKAAKGKKANKPVGSEFFNTLTGLLGDKTMKLGAMWHGCDVKTRDSFANMDVAGYNYGIFRYKGDLKKYPNRLILGSETFCRDAVMFWEMAKKNPRIVGDFVWAGMDYLGEAGIGSWEYEDYAPRNDPENPGWLSAGSGRVDLMGYENGEAAYTRIAFEQEEGVRLAVRPVCMTGWHSPSSWKMTDAIESWSYRGHEGKKAVVEVYSRADTVALLINGREVSRKKMGKSFVKHFTLPYENGELIAVGYDASGREMGRRSLVTAGESTVLNVQSESPVTGKDGLAYVQIAYTDENGVWKPDEKHRVRVRVEGGKLLGLGNACPFNPDGFLKDNTGTYYGRALAVVQADEGADKVTVTVEDGKRRAGAVIRNG